METMLEMTEKVMFEVSYMSPESPLEAHEIMLVLADKAFKKGLTISVGIAEAQAISMTLNKISAPRPLAHDLLLDVIEKLQRKVLNVEIYDIKDVKIALLGNREITTESFLARINLVNAQGEKMFLDARPSDAVALALRAGAPIFVAEKLLEETRDEEFQEKARRQYARRMLTKMEENDLKKFKV